jgi:hypothetical protein
MEICCIDLGHRRVDRLFSSLWHHRQLCSQVDRDGPRFSVLAQLEQALLKGNESHGSSSSEETSVDVLPLPYIGYVAAASEAI